MITPQFRCIVNDLFKMKAMGMRAQPEAELLLRELGLEKELTTDEWV